MDFSSLLHFNAGVDKDLCMCLWPAWSTLTGARHALSLGHVQLIDMHKRPRFPSSHKAPAVSGCVMRFTQKIPNGKKWMEMVQAALEKVETITKRNESTKL